MTLGSCSNTSRPAPAIFLPFSARTSAASSTIAPRAVLIRNAVFFISPSSRAPIWWRVCGVERLSAARRNRIRAAAGRAARRSARPRAPRSPACGAASSRARACRSRGRGAPPPCRSARRRRSARWSCPRRTTPSRWRDCPPGNLPARTRRSPSTMRRATASISPKLRSAVASVVTGGTTVTGMRRAVAAATSMLDGEIDCDAMWRELRVGGDHVAVDPVVQQAEQDVGLLHGRDQRRLRDDPAVVRDRP